MSEEKITSCTTSLKDNPAQPSQWYELGMELAKLNRFSESLDAFTKGLCYGPFNPDLRLQRGRKHITADHYIEALADLTLATRLHAKYWENWYYCGVAAYMGGFYDMAMGLHEKCIEVMQENNIEEIPAAACWYWQSAVKAGRREEGDVLLKKFIYKGIPCSNMDYTHRCYLYAGLETIDQFDDLEALRESLKDEDRPDLYYITLCHGLATYCWYNGMQERSKEILRIIKAMPTWHECFAYKQTLQDMKERGID